MSMIVTSLPTPPHLRTVAALTLGSAESDFSTRFNSNLD